MAIIDLEARDERARNLEADGFNGLRLALVEISGSEAFVELRFFNANELTSLLADVGDDPKDIFAIRGGHRLRGGEATGQVQVTDVQPVPGSASSLRLTIRPIGDYSIYTLTLSYRNMDPVFDEIQFKFRPGCFSTECAPERRPGVLRPTSPVIDYLAKDFDSFRHALIAAMRQRVPGWEPSSEADFSMVLINLLSAAGDELSDYQDRVMNEAYLNTARNRVSLARHARLMDYHIHQGNQASTWLALQLADGQQIELRHDDPQRFLLEASSIGGVTFLAPKPGTEAENQTLDSRLNDLRLYTWSGTQTGLAKDAVEADLLGPDEDTAKAVARLIRDGEVPHLLIQEHRNPDTGGIAGSDPNKRQLLRLLVDDGAPLARQDPVAGTGDWYCHVRWREQDSLEHDYCFSDPVRDDLSLFHGNVVHVYQGQLIEVKFKHSGPLQPDERLVQRIPEDEQHKGNWKPGKSPSVLCELPAKAPLVYRPTPIDPRGEHPPQSTLAVDVRPSGATTVEPWTEVISLIHSREGDSHYAVESDEVGRNIVRFGNGVNGRELPAGAEVRCSYQAGLSADGNVGADRVITCPHPLVAACWNPFDVINGRAPEPHDEIVRYAPEAYRARQLRAVTLDDYVKRAQELPQVAKSAARYMWTGSWRTVRITVDPVGRETVDDALRAELARHLDAVRLLGEDLEIRPPQFVPFVIELRICVHADFWPSDVRFDLDEAFTDGFTSTGEMGFFHADRWTFGQNLHTSQIIGRAQRVSGVERVIAATMRRWDSPTPGNKSVGPIEIGPSEIILLHNDPDNMERGSITFDLRGGRR